MERRNFLKKLFSTAVVATIVPTIIIPKIDEKKYIIGVDPYLPKEIYAGPGILAQVEQPNLMYYENFPSEKEFEKMVLETITTVHNRNGKTMKKYIYKLYDSYDKKDLG